MKTKRLQLICDLIKKYSITTQEELLDYLKKSGFEVTQATVSRDIRELRLIKTLDKQGCYRYTLSEDNSGKLEAKYRTIVRESVVSAGRANNIVMIKCYVGMGNAACAALDTMTFENIVGTLAGDDTILALFKDDSGAEMMMNTLQNDFGVNG